MSELRRVLGRYVPSGPTLGPQQTAEWDASALSQLSADLNSISSRNLTFVWLCFAALIVLFVGSGLILVRYLDRPTQLQAIYAVTGLSTLGTVAQMIKLWKDKVSADLTLALARRLRPEDTRAVLEILLRSL
jgi:hypothetical protein